MAAILKRIAELPPTGDLTPEDLLPLPDGDEYELVDGKLVGRETGLYGSLAMAALATRLGTYVAEHRLGWTPSSRCGYQCFPNAPSKVRKPDVSFISLQRMPAARLHEGHVPIPPDLAVEVVSPNDGFSEVIAKLHEYLGAVVPLVWIVDPPSRSVYVHRQDRTITHVQAGEELSGEDVVPGFRCLVADLFPAAPPAPAETT